VTHPEPKAPPAALINSASRALTRLNDRRLKPLGLTYGQMPVLVALSTGDALSQKELARLARIEQPSMAQLLARMERDGLITRTPDPVDGRVSLISLTGPAKAKLPLARVALEGTNDQALAGFGGPEVEVLRSLLTRFLANLETDRE
jgi:MarR family transcriptional regulator for hemolysin